jgi:hypothetical protein
MKYVTRSVADLMVDHASRAEAYRLFRVPGLGPPIWPRSRSAARSQGATRRPAESAPPTPAAGLATRHS